MSTPSKTASPFQLIADLWEVAGDDHDADVLEHLLVKSGWCWRCKGAADAIGRCGFVNGFDDDRCAGCGVTRPLPEAVRS